MVEIWVSHVPGRGCSSSRRKFSPRQKNFTWKHNCQIRNNKLYYHIFLSSQTVLRNLNLHQITKKFPIQKRINTKKVKLKFSIKSQMSQNQANAKNAIRNPRQILLALKSAQITNKYKNLTPHLSNQLPFHSAGTSKMDIPRSTANSVGEQLRTVSQINEPSPKTPKPLNIYIL